MKYISSIISLILAASMAYGAGGSFTAATADKTYSMELPNGWTMLDNDQLAKIANGTSNRENMLIGANDFDSNGASRATALLSIRAGKSLTQQDLKSLTKSDIKKYEDVSRKQMGAANLPDGTKAKVVSLNVQHINGKASLVTETELTTITGKRIRQISDSFFFGDKSVKMTVTYDPANGKQYRPIVTKIRNSLRIN